MNRIINRPKKLEQKQENRTQTYTNHLFWRNFIMSLVAALVVVTGAYMNNAYAQIYPIDGNTGMGNSDSEVVESQAAPEQSINLIEGYIVLFKPEEGTHSTAEKINALSKKLVIESSGVLSDTYNNLQGFHAVLSQEAAQALKERDDIAEVIPNEIVSIGESLDLQDLEITNNLVWGLDRIDQRELPLDNVYNPNGDGATVHVYVFDTGIRKTHKEFEERVTAGYSSLGDTAEDCNGHGTLVSSVIGGKSYGVAKGVQLHPVRVLKCDGSGTWATVLAGINWLIDNHKAPAIVNMSLGGPANLAIDKVIQKAIDAGITFVVASGNHGKEACDYTPARLDTAITVAASTSADNVTSFSNSGNCVDIFAPGDDITGAWHSNDEATKTMDGTSLAASHVTGAAALYLQSNPQSKPAEVLAAITTNATKDKLKISDSQSVGATMQDSDSDSDQDNSVEQSTPNRLLYALFDTTAPTPTTVPTTIPPTAVPTAVPPTAAPTTVPPTTAPTAVPPTTAPTAIPPTGAPTTVPPTGEPTAVPPTTAPTTVPPTGAPTTLPPTAVPTIVPTNTPPPKDATLSIQPAVLNMAVGQSQTFAISVNPATSPLNKVQVHVQVDPVYLELVGIQNNMAQLPQVSDPLKFDAATGRFQYGAKTANGTISAPFDIVQVTVKALAPITQTVIQFLDNSPKTDISGPEGSILQEARGGTVSINTGGGHSEHAILDGYIGLQGRIIGMTPAKVVPLNVKVYPAGSNTPIKTFDVTTDADAHFIESCLMPGTYDIELSSEHTLTSRVKNVTLDKGENRIYLGELLEGDIEQNNQINSEDLTPLQTAFNRCGNSQESLAGQSTTGFVPATDLNHDTCTNILDFGLLSGNFNRQGPVEYDNQSLSELPNLESQEAVIGFEEGVRILEVGETAQLGLFITPNGSPVNGANIHLHFEPEFIEVLKLELLNNHFPEVLEGPSIDSTAGVIRFSTGTLGGTIGDRFQLATLEVKLKKETNGSPISFPRAFPVSDVSGPDGSALASVEAIVLANNSDENIGPGLEGTEGGGTFEVKTQLFLPIVGKNPAIN